MKNVSPENSSLINWKKKYKNNNKKNVYKIYDPYFKRNILIMGFYLLSRSSQEAGQDSNPENQEPSHYHHCWTLTQQPTQTKHEAEGMDLTS